MNGKRMILCIGIILVFLTIGVGIGSAYQGIPPTIINGDWVVDGNEVRSDETIILYGNLIIPADASLTMDNVQLELNGTSDGQCSITVQQWGKLFTRNGSRITGNFYYYFNNYGYLNIQNTDLNKAYSIHFYDSSDDFSVINGSVIKDNKQQGIYLSYASPSVTNNVIKNSVQGIYIDRSSALIENNILSNQSNGIYSNYNSGYSLNIKNNTISNNTGSGVYYNSNYPGGSAQIIGNTIENNSGNGLDLGYSTSAILDSNLIRNNKNYGIISYYGTNTINNSVISGNIYGVYQNYGSATVNNSTIYGNNYGISNSGSTVVSNSTINSSSYDYYSSGTIKSINSTFNKLKVILSGSGSLQVFWFDTVQANKDHLPIDGVSIEIYDNRGFKEDQGITDSNGKVKLNVQEYTQTSSQKISLAPHFIKAFKDTDYGSIYSNITETKQDFIDLSSEPVIYEAPISKNGDWVINDMQSYSNLKIILNGNPIIHNGGSLKLDNVTLSFRFLGDNGYGIKIESGGKFYLNNSVVTVSYPELGYSYNFDNYGYLNIQNSTVSGSSSIHFYDSSDDSSVINGSVIKDNKRGIYLSYASPSVTNNVIKNSVQGIYIDRSSALIENNTLSNQSYGIYSNYNSGYSLNIKNNTISNNTGSGVYYDSNYPGGSAQIIGNTIENNSGNGLDLGYSTSAIIYSNLIRNNKNYGITSYYGTNAINNSVISGNIYGVYQNYGSATVNNSTIYGNNYGISNSGSTLVSNSTINSSSYDYYSSGTIKSINSTFNKSKVSLSGSGLLDIYWYDTIQVLNDSVPLSGALVQAFDKDLNKVSEGTSDENGKIIFSIREYTQTSSTITGANPYKMKASKQGFPDGFIESNITASKNDTILMGQGEFTSDLPITISGDWIINNTQSYSNKNVIIDSGNLIIRNNGSLFLNNTLLKLRYTTNGGYGIKIESGGKFYLNNSVVTVSYPELGYSYNFDNYGYLNIQNSTVSGSSSIHFYDSSDDSSVINGSVIKDNKRGIYLSYASPSVTNNVIKNSVQGIYIDRSSALIENNTLSNQSYGIYSNYNSGYSLNIKNNTISNNTGSGVYYDSNYPGGSAQIIGNTIENNSGNGLDLGYSTSAIIYSNLIRNNKNYGITSYYGTNAINNSVISGNIYGVYQNYGSATVNNSTINSSSYDYSTSGTITSINSFFNKTKVSLSGSGLLDVYWYDTIQVLNDSVPVSVAYVQTFDKNLDKVSEGTTDENGKITLSIREYTQNSVAKTNANPYKITASKQGLPDGSIESSITASKNDIILMGQGEFTSDLPLTINGDWNINNTQSYADKKIYLKGNLVIQNGGSLTLDNITLLIQLLGPQQYSISVQKGGELNIRNSFLSPAYTALGFYYPFNVYGLLNMDNSTVKMATSVYFDSTSDKNSTIIGSTLIRNRDYGLYITRSNPKVSGNLLQYNGNGIRVDYTSVNVSDTVIAGSSQYDYYINSNSKISSINTSFDKSKVSLYDSSSIFDNSWYLNVKAVDANGNPISNANVSVDNSTGTQIFSGSTDSQGLAKNIVVKEYRRTTAATTNYNPHTISATFDNVTAQTSVNVDSNKEVTLSLNMNQPLKVTILEPVNNSIFVQNNSISFNALGFDPQDGILKGSAIDWISSIDGLVGSGESLTSSSLSLGMHQITAKATNSKGESVNDSVNIQVIGRSDLTIDGINWNPTKINEGESVTFNASIRNIGTGYTLSPFYLRFLVDNQYIGQKRIDRLNASESTVVTQQWTAKAYAKNVTVIADYYNNIGEIDETNNILTTSLTEVKQADLIVSNLTWTPQTFHDGTPVTFEAEIRNIGSGNASRPFDVGFYINESKIGTVNVSESLLAGNSRKVSVTWNAVPGTYTLNVKADDKNTILESNESNNIGSALLPPVYQPDLRISNVKIPSTIDDGSTVNFNATVENFGLNSTDNWFGVRFYIDGNDIGYAVIAGLPAGGNKTVSKSWTATPGSHVLTVRADADGWYSSPYNAYGPRVNESNETNNNFTLTLPKVEQSDLIVSSVSWTPENFSTGDSVTFNASIKNIGNGSTLRNFNTAFNINGNIISIKTTPGLLKGGYAYLSRAWTATSGEHNVSIIVDYNGWVNESNESNNILATNLSYTEEKYLLTVSSDSPSYGENGTAVFTAKASSLASPNVYLKGSDVNLTLAILDENNSIVYNAPMTYNTTAGFTASVNLAGYPKGNYVARVTLSDKNGLTAEKTVQFKITENFKVFISTDKSIYDREEIVRITGRAQYGDGSPVINAPALLDIKLKGYTQTFSLVTDANGNLSYNFKPGKTEAGNFTAKLSVNSNRLWISSETSFNMYGLYLSPSGIVDYGMSKNSSENITFTLRNCGETVLNGINVRLDGDTISGIETQILQTPPETLAAGAQKSFIVKISAVNVAVSNANYTVRVTTTEGSYEEAKLFVHLVDAKPAAVVSPTSLVVGTNPNSYLVKTVTISNAGYESMNNINISKPSLDWISVSPADLGSISPGMNKSFNILLHPDNNTSVGVYQETITITSSNHQPVNVYLKISVTSSEKGDLMFHVANDIGQNISGASVTIQNPAVLTEVFQGTTNESGYYLFKNISVGTYNYFVTASGHTSVSGSSSVSPGIQTLVEPVLSKDVLSAQLTVTPVQIKDDYDILLNLTFETDVPPPVLIPSPLYLRYGVNFSDPVYESDSSITISNPGLVSIYNVTVDSSSLQGVNITFPTGNTFFVDELKAKSSIKIPYHLNVTYVACGGEAYRNSIHIRGDYLTFEENSDVTRKVYLSSELPVFVNMYNCPVNTSPVSTEIEEYFKYYYNSPGGSYSSGFSGDQSIPQVIETVHERVKFNIPQKATLERDAFAASLELTNKLTDQNIDNVRVKLAIKDKNGNDASSLFFVNLTSLNSINSVDGSGVISPSAVADVNWLLVPEYNAGGTSPSGKEYKVQAFINYTVNGVPFSTNSTEENITVMPQPLLNLTYTIPRDIKADTPFNLTLNVTNVGYGTAKNLKLDSAQPVIYENKAGLLISLKLIGSGLVGGPETDSIIIDFGDLAPGQSKEAYWIMTSSLDGEFTEFSGSFSHSNALGGAETSLIKSINYIIKMSAPVADFTSNVTNGYTPFSVQFTDLSQDATKWNWEFGDGNTSKEQNPIYTYNTTGTYTVNLTVTNSWGSNKTTKSNYINVGYITPTINVNVMQEDSLTPTFSWTSNSKGYPQQQYQLEVWKMGEYGLVMETKEWDTQGTGTTTSVIYSGNSLVSGEWYVVRVRTFDGYSWSEWGYSIFRPFGGLIDKVEQAIEQMAASDPMKNYAAKEASQYMNTIGRIHKYEYDIYINNVGIYRSAESLMLQDALTQAKKGDAAKVDRDLKIANIDSQYANNDFQNACDLYINALNGGIFVAKTVQTISVMALKVGIVSAGWPPQAATALDVMVTAYDDMAIDDKTVDQTAWDIVKDQILGYIISKDKSLPGLDGKTIEESISSPEIWRSKSADNLYTTLINALKSENAATDVIVELRMLSPDISEEFAKQIWNLATDQIEKGLNSEVKRLEASLHSPGELRVIDSNGKVTGLVNGTIVKEIPNSVYDAENKTVIILDAYDTYKYEVIGTGTGEYGLNLLLVNGTEYTPISLQNTIIPNEIHQYKVDWGNVSTEKAISLNIDSNGDGTFDSSTQISLPTALFTYAYLTNQHINFDASSSEDNIVSYKWDFGDGTNNTGKIVEHTYLDEGDYDVTLTVENDNRGFDRKTRNIRIDLTPPVTTANLSGTLGDDNWYTSDVQVNLTATDGIYGTGINKTEYSFDNASWNTYNTPFNISNNGSTTLYYHSTDNAGNIELTKNETIEIKSIKQDLISPTIQSVILSPANIIAGSVINISVNASDNVGVSNVRANDIELLKQDVNIWNGSIIAREGTHSVNVSAIDVAGNIAWNNSTTYTAVTPDNLPPSSIIDLKSTNGTTWINWTWSNPKDFDFNHTEIYLNGVFLTNTSAEYFNATDLQPETNYTLSTRTVDNYKNVNQTWVNASEKTLSLPDTVPPVIKSVILLPTSATTGSTISVTVDATDNVGVSSVKANDIELLNQGGNIWNGNITASEGTHFVNVSAVDGIGNIAWNNSTSYTAVSPDTLPPSSISNLQSNNGTTWINWTWTNPIDTDFNHTEIYLNGTFQANTTTEFFNATGLKPETSYTLSTRTIDNYGNVNQTWVNASANTSSLPDTTSPIIESVILFPTNTTTGSSINVSATVTDNIRVSSVTANGIPLYYQGGSIWSWNITALEGTHSVNVSAIDGASNIAWNNSTAYTAVTPDVLPPSSITNLLSVNGTTWINWTWTNPKNSDFNHTEIYLNGVFQTNTSAENFNASNLQPETSYTLNTRTVDNYGNVNQTWVNTSAKTGSLPDNLPPVIESVTVFPAVTTTGSAINVTVNVTDNIGVSSVRANDIPLLYQGGNIWSRNIAAFEGTHSVNVSAMDEAGNVAWNNTTSYTALTPDTVPPSSITNIQSTSSTAWIKWTWKNPTEADFDHSEIYINGILQINTSDEYFNATGLESQTIYVISTRTVDKSGNVNETWVNASAKTLSLADNLPPVIESVTVFPAVTTTGSAINVTVNVTDNIGVSIVRANDIPLLYQGGIIWSRSIAAFEGIHSVNVSAEDEAGNIAWNNSTSYTATTVIPDNLPPSSIINLQHVNGINWIKWIWQNPKDLDFYHTEIYLNGIFQTITSAEFFNATNLQQDTDYTFSTRTVDTNGNVNATWVNSSTKTGSIQDTISPVIESVILFPTNTTTDSAINVTVNVTDNIGVNSVRANDIPFLNLGGSIWSGNITALEGIHYVNVSAVDGAGNVAWNNSTTYTALNSTNGSTWINWTWHNPTDHDFNHTEIYLNGTFQTNTTAEFFNATGLQPETSYTISTRTVDNSGNINQTWVNSSAKTASLSDTTPPSSITNLQSTKGTTWLNWTWTNPSNPDFNHTEIYLNGIFQINTSAEFFNATGLQPETSYTFSTRTVDNYGNVNETWINSTATTDKRVVSDVEKPVIQLVVLFPANTTTGSKINVTVNVTDNVGVMNVTAGNVQLTNTGSFWQGSFTAPSSVGSYSMLINASDAAGNIGKTSASYKVVQLQGGAGITVLPRSSNITAGSTIPLIIKVKNTQNIDDTFKVRISISELPVSSQANLTWFNWTDNSVSLLAGQTVQIPIQVTVPAGTATGTKLFRAYVTTGVSMISGYDSGNLIIK